MRSADDILPDVMPRLPGVPVPTVERELLRAAQEMCRRSRCWTVWSEPVTLAAGETEYEVDVPDGGQVELVVGMTMDGLPADVLPWQWANRAPEDQGGGDVVTTGSLVFRTGAAVRDGAVVRLKLVLVPGDNAAGIPDAVFDPYRDVLADGVIARCALIPKQAWTEPQLAAAHGAAFSAAVSRMALKEFQGRTNAMPRLEVGWC